eukprot:6204409-Pleurochrysis_carterae.AAC.5
MAMCGPRFSLIVILECSCDPCLLLPGDRGPWLDWRAPFFVRAGKAPRVRTVGTPPPCRRRGDEGLFASVNRRRCPPSPADNGCASRCASRCACISVRAGVGAGVPA